MSKPLNIVVTGGNSGIGYETVKSLYEEGHNVIFGSRNKTRNEEALKTITQKQGGSLAALSLDLSVRASVEQFAAKVQEKFPNIDILVNNSGVILNEKQVNEQGIEMTLATNHFGHFFLTYLLWGALKKSPQARIINVSSAIHYRAPKDYLQDLPCNNKSYNNFDQYAISKLYNVLFTQGLEKLMQSHKLPSMRTVSLHPGVVETNFGRESCLFNLFRCLCCCVFFNQEQGARNTLNLCRWPLKDLRSGEYYHEDSTVKEMDARGRKQADVQKLWDISEKLYGVSFK